MCEGGVCEGGVCDGEECSLSLYLLLVGHLIC